MAVRNFWIAAEIDGRRTPLAGGPAGKAGGFRAYIYQRHNGGSETAAEIRGHVGEDGRLLLDVWVPMEEGGAVAADVGPYLVSDFRRPMQAGNLAMLARVRSQR